MSFYFFILKIWEGETNTTKSESLWNKITRVYQSGVGEVLTFVPSHLELTSAPHVVPLTGPGDDLQRNGLLSVPRGVEGGQWGKSTPASQLGPEDHVSGSPLLHV